MMRSTSWAGAGLAPNAANARGEAPIRARRISLVMEISPPAATQSGPSRGTMERRAPPLKCRSCNSFLLGCGALELALQLRHAHRRARGVRAGPALVDLVDRQRIEVVPAFAPLARRDHQVRFLEHFQMLHDRAAIELRKQAAQHAGGQGLVAQLVEDLPADRRGQRLERPV